MTQETEELEFFAEYYHYGNKLARDAYFKALEPRGDVKAAEEAFYQAWRDYSGYTKT